MGENRNVANAAPAAYKGLVKKRKSIGQPVIKT